jgi:hypothetical protein
MKNSVGTKKGKITAGMVGCPGHGRGIRKSFIGKRF